MEIALLYAIKLLILPPGGLFVLAVIGLIFRRRRFGMPLMAMGLLGLLALSLPVVVGAWARVWECYPPLQARQVQQFRPQALVVIGGGVGNNATEYQTPWTINTRTLLRLRYAAKLAREFELPVLVSGGRFTERQGGSEAELMAQVLEQEFKIPVTWQEQQSRNTSENARFSRELLRRQGIDTIVLVTQAYHMPRALSEFNKAGFNVLPAPTAFVGGDSALSVFDFLPSPIALMNSFLMAHESVGMLWFAAGF